MTIYKDGKPYKTFSQPNPLTGGQLSIKDLRFHNLKWNSTKIKNEIKQEVSELAIPDKIIHEENNEIIHNKTEDQYVIPDKDILILHVLPVNYIKFTDPLYGEVRENKNFGEKYVVNSVVIDLSMTGIKLITQEIIPENYIIFPSKYKDGRSAEIKKWWKIISSTPEDDNYLTIGIISDFHPSF